MRNRLVLRAALTASLVLSACAAEKTGPAPKVEALSPSLVCAEQLTTAVAITGADLSPLGIDVATKDPLLALPAIAVRRTQDLSGAAVEGLPVELPNDPKAPDASRVTWTSPTSMTIEVYPELALEPGLYEITATNKNGQSVTLPGALTVVPRPKVDTAVPDLVCLEQGMRPVTVNGTGFLKVGSALPQVTIGTLTLPVDALESCAALPGPTTAESCTVAKISVPEDALPAGAFEVSLTNPAPAACESTDLLRMAVVPRPALQKAEPDLLCLAEGERAVTLTGTGFVSVGGVLPTVTFADGKQLVATAAENCAAIEGTTLAAQSCTTLQLSVPEAWLEPGVFSLTVTNPDPAGCHSEDTVTMAIAPPPSVSALTPDLTCLAEDARTFTLSGSGFIVLRGETEQYPQVQIGAATFTPTAARECEAIAGTLLTAESCRELDLTIPANGLPSGSVAVVVTNPQPAGCSSTESLTLAVVPEPSLATVEPDLFCSEQGATLTLTGTGFVKIGTALPTVVLGTGANAVQVPADSADSCTAIAGTLSGAQSCTGLTVTVPANAVAAGATAVAVRNPMSAGCTSNEARSVAVLGRPVIAAVEPAAVCADNQPASLDVVGTGFLFNTSSGAEPVLTVDGATLAISNHSGCVAVMGGGAGYELCTRITFAVPTGGFPDGLHTVQVANPEPADCAASVGGEFNVTGVPTLTAVTPLKVCRTGGAIVATGTGFVSTSSLELTLDGAVNSLATTYVDPETLNGDVPPMLPGTYDVTVSNGVGCESPTAVPLRVVEQPFVFFVDPPVVYNGIKLQATVYASGISDAVVSIGIKPAGSADAPTDLTFAYDPTRPNRILVDIPAGLAAGEYDVVLVDSTCSAQFDQGLKVTNTLSVSVAAIDPPFGWTNSRTPVDITSATNPPTGLTNFAATPRAYLNPQTPGGFATELRSVAFLDALHLSGVVPSGLTVDTYDLIVINPDGGVGLLPGAYKVVAEPPPAVDAISPASVAAQIGQVTEILGANLRAGATAVATCSNGGTSISVPGVTNSVATDGLSMTVTWNMSTAGAGSICIVRVSNTDGTYTDYSALMVTTSSGNPNPPTNSMTMLTGRRALAAAAVRMNHLERYLFAIGGDDGAATPIAYASVESARVDALGRVVESYSEQRNALPAPRSFISAAVIGRYVYVPGGRVAGAATNEVLRAYLLDPFEAAEITDLDVKIDADLATGLGGGTWYYRIAAVLAANDPNNPGGEALAGEPTVVRLPSSSKALQLTLNWNAVPNAAFYRIYRSPTADLTAGSERLMEQIAAVPGTVQTYRDDGHVTVDPAGPKPLPLGSLGKWHTVVAEDGSTLQLASAREGAGVVAVTDPANPGNAVLYVLGGRSNATTALSSIEYAVVTSSASNAQTVKQFATAASTLGAARWLLGAVYVDAGRAVSLQGTSDAYIYALTGSAAADMATAVRNIDGFKVDFATGAPGPRITVDAPANVPGGYGYAAGSNYLYLFGRGGTPSSTIVSAAICTASTGGCGGGGAPAIVNWNNASVPMVAPRFLHASASESGFVFLLGGQTSTPVAAASQTTESTNF